MKPYTGKLQRVRRIDRTGARGRRRQDFGDMSRYYIQIPPGMPQPDDEAPSVPSWYSAHTGIDTSQGIVRAYANVAWTRNTEGDVAGYRLRHRRLMDYGTGTGSTNLFTDTDKTWAPDAYIGCTLVDSDNDEWTITDNDGTTLTIGGTPATGMYSIRASYEITWVPQENYEGGLVPSTVGTTIHGLELETDYDFSVSAVDVWSNCSAYCTTVVVTTPTYVIPLNPPQPLPPDFKGKDCQLHWEPPVEVGPERDYKVEVRTRATTPETVLATYYTDATHFEVSYDENARINDGIAQPHLYFYIYTRDVLGNLSDPVTIDAINPVPSTPTNCVGDPTGTDFTIAYDPNDMPSDPDVTHYVFEVELGTA